MAAWPSSNFAPGISKAGDAVGQIEPILRRAN